MNKPKFDPNKPFTVRKPSATLNTTMHQESLVDEPTSKLESLLRGAEQGATFGFGDEINAGLESLLSDKSYEQARQESRQAFEQAQMDNPYTSLLGNLVGGIAVPIPGATEASVGRMALIGAGGGALAGLGTSEADLTKGEIGKAAGDVLEGTAIGGVTGGTLGLLQKGASAASRAWKDTESAKNLGKMFQFARADKEFNTSDNLKKTAEQLTKSIHDEYLPSIFNLSDEPSIQSAINEQYELAKEAARSQNRSLDFKTFRDKITKQLDEVQIKDPNFQKGRKDIEGFLDALGQVERKEQSILTPDIQQADEAMGALKSQVGKALVTSDEAIRKVAKKYAEEIAESSGPGIDKAQLEEDIFTQLKSKYVENFNPKYGVDIDPTTGKKFAKAEFETPTGTTKVKAKELVPEMRTETMETIGRPELTPEVLDAAIKKGQDIFDVYNLGNQSTSRNADLASVGLKIKELAGSEAQDPVLGGIADFMRSKFGEIKGKLGLDFRGLSGDDLKKAQIDAADKIKNMLLTAMKKPGSAGEIRFDDANAVAKQLAEAGYIDGSKIASTAEKLKVMAEKEFLMRTAQGESLLSSNTEKHLLLPFSAKAKGLQLASAAGKVAGKLDDAGVTKLASNMMRFVTSDTNVIANLATKLEKSNSSFAPVLRNLASQPEQKRKAMMFSLMQQPAFRQAINTDSEE